MPTRTVLLFTLCLFVLVPFVSAGEIFLSGDDVNTTIGFQSFAITTCQNVSDEILLAGADLRQTVSTEAFTVGTCRGVADMILLAGDDVRTTIHLEPPCPSCVTPIPIPGYSGIPTDPDGDCLYEDLTGNGSATFTDVVLFFEQMDWIIANEPTAAFDFSGNGAITFKDIVLLFEEV